MRLISIAQRKKDVRRIKEIADILIKYGLGYVIDSIRIKEKLIFLKKLKTQVPEEQSEQTIPVRVRKALEELGPTFIKMGQILSTREDLIGGEFAGELSKLQDDTPPFEFEKVEGLIKKELGKPIDEIFASFERAPVASASVAQAHKAVLKNGESVIVKVQRMGIEEQIMDDMNIIRYFAELAEKHMAEAQQFNLPGIVNEFERSIIKELDFRLEARNQLKFRKQFENDATIYIPKVHQEYSTKKILVQEYVEGVKLIDVLRTENTFDKRLIARRGAAFFFKQVLANGFFHADPHPGNILVLKDNVLCFLDFGMVGHLDNEFIEDLTHLMVFLVNYNVKGLINELLDMGLVNETIDLKSLKYDILDLMEMYYGSELKDVEVGVMLQKLLYILTKYRVELPREFVLLIRAMILVEGVGKKLDPEFNVVEVFTPFAENTVKKDVTPEKLVDVLMENVFELKHFMKSIPGGVKRILTKLESGKIKIEFEHKNLNVFSYGLERTSNKISVALIISALIVGSSLIMQTEKGVLFLEFPVLGILGFIISAVLGILLVISIFRYHEL